QAAPRDPGAGAAPHQPADRPAVRHEPLDPGVLRRLDAASDTAPALAARDLADGGGHRRGGSADLLFRGVELRSQLGYLAVQRRRTAGLRSVAVTPAAGLGADAEAVVGRRRLPDAVRDPATTGRPGYRQAQSAERVGA